MEEEQTQQQADDQKQHETKIKAVDNLVKTFHEMGVAIGRRVFIVAYDHSQASDRALRCVLFDLAQAERQDQVIIASCGTEKDKEEKERELAKCLSMVKAFSSLEYLDVKTRFVLVDGTKKTHIAKRICTLAEHLGAHYIVLGCRGLSGVKKQLLGSVSEYIVHNATCPVLVTRYPEEG
eukprot:CAMPEP_0174260940 /NCGR_PEP_ID=MMETSP0439-20130205/11060_1 /TAXON_ID=0 /ORGANISM="Stereomyxa ramosa, Strain Chinc5" /LENGTH=178 /DNA_ID=CAMNT_0015345331 /DNA_START=27 /DNA_END=563 /DNA_ORIENTATION=+